MTRVSSAEVLMNRVDDLKMEALVTENQKFIAAADNAVNEIKEPLGAEIKALQTDTATACGGTPECGQAINKAVNTEINSSLGVGRAKDLYLVAFTIQNPVLTDHAQAILDALQTPANARVQQAMQSALMICTGK